MSTYPEESKETPYAKLCHVDASLVEGQELGADVTITIKGTVKSFSASNEEYPYNELCVDLKSAQIVSGKRTVFEELSEDD